MRYIPLRAVGAPAVENKKKRCKSWNRDTTNGERSGRGAGGRRAIRMVATEGR